MAKYKKKLDDDIRCPLEYGLAIFGGKWKSRIICVLAAKERLRYSALRKEMYNITDAVLAATLKDLMEDGIVDRKSYDEIPPRVEYTLTPSGDNAVRLLFQIYDWGYQEMKRRGLEIDRRGAMFHGYLEPDPTIMNMSMREYLILLQEEEEEEQDTSE